MYKASSLALAAIAGLTMPAIAADLSGEWLRENGATRVSFAPCGDLVCGTIVWQGNPDSPAKVGSVLFVDMKPAGENQWSGQAIGPEDGKPYPSKITLSGDTLNTEACVMGGLVCKSTSWTPAR